MKNLNRLKSLIEDGKNVFLTGGAGVGKSFLLRELIDSLEQEGKKIAKLASTGMAASLIGGQTLHSFFKLGISSHSFDLERSGKLEIDKKSAKILKDIDLIVIDEISMVSSGVIDMVRLRLLQSDSKAKLIVSGDFLQLPPVFKDSQKYAFMRENLDIPVERVYGFAFESEAWQRFSFINIDLTEVKRSSDKEFVKILSKIRYGIKDEEVLQYLKSLTASMPDNIKNHTVLFGKNISVDRHNALELSMLEGESYLFETQVQKHEKNIKDNEIERFLIDSRLPRVLELKVGAPILFLRNSWNYFNGERGVIVAINEEQKFIHILKDNGKVVRVEKGCFSKKEWKQVSADKKKKEVEQSRFDLFQFPICLAYAITIHKSQGMSLLDLVIDTKEIFVPSQFYVALSRAISPKRLILLNTHKNMENFIYPSSKAIDFYENLSLS